MIGNQAHALLLLRVAAKAVADARRAWIAATSPTSSASTIRAAFRACVLASRTSLRAAAASSDKEVAAKLTEQSEQLDGAAATLKHRLAG